MVHHVGEVGKAPIVVKAALRVRPQSLQRRRAVFLVRRPIGLEVVDPNVDWRVHVGRKRLVGGNQERVPSFVASSSSVSEPDSEDRATARQILLVEREELRRFVAYGLRQGSKSGTCYNRGPHV
jgi:hypothetical protein